MLQPDLRACKLSMLIRFFTSRPGMHAACTQHQSSLDSKHPIMSDKTRSSRRRLRKVRLHVATPPFRKASERPSVGRTGVGARALALLFCSARVPVNYCSFFPVSRRSA